MFFQHQYLMNIDIDTFFFRSPATAVADGIINLHNHIFYTSVLIIIFISYIILWIIMEYINACNIDNRNSKREMFFFLRKFKHDTELEIAWTLIPCFILLLIALPSFSFLYIIERVPFISLFFKAIGHQWYWSYEVGPYDGYFFLAENSKEPLLVNKLYNLFTSVKAEDLANTGSKSSKVDQIGFVKKVSLFFFSDSYMIDEAELNVGEARLLTVDVPLVLPYGVFVGLLTSSVDVIHSFAIPEFGVKLDAIPGRINQFAFLINHSGIFYGQCSELCGVGHAFMPISIYAIDKNFFFDTLQNLVNAGSYSSKLYYDVTHQKLSKSAAVDLFFEEEEQNLTNDFAKFVPNKSFLGLYKSPENLNFKF
jgi:heme/copper-type cytochrome/quinol oxidase subunit 2